MRVVLNAQPCARIVLFDIRFACDDIFGKIAPAVLIRKDALSHAALHDIGFKLDIVCAVVDDRLLFPLSIESYVAHFPIQIAVRYVARVGQRGIEKPPRKHIADPFGRGKRGHIVGRVIYIGERLFQIARIE